MEAVARTRFDLLRDLPEDARVCLEEVLDERAARPGRGHPQSAAPKPQEPDVTLPRGEFRCRAPGCDRTLTTAAARASHEWSIHQLGQDDARRIEAEAIAAGDPDGPPPFTRIDEPVDQTKPTEPEPLPLLERRTIPASMWKGSDGDEPVEAELDVVPEDVPWLFKLAPETMDVVEALAFLRRETPEECVLRLLAVGLNVDLDDGARELVDEVVRRRAEAFDTGSNGA